MRKALSLGALAVALAAGSAPSFGESTGEACWQTLAAADRDGDRLVSAEEAAAALDRAFLRIDANRDGMVSSLEHRNCLLDSGGLVGFLAPPRRTQKRFAEIDANGDGAVSLEEHLRAGEEAFAEASGGEPQASLSRFATEVGEQGSGQPDTNGDEAVSQAEAALDVVRGFALMDVDGDRRLTRLEWATVVERPKFPRSYRALDRDGDRRVTPNELQAAWTAGAERQIPMTVWRHAQLSLLPDSAALGRGGGSAAGGSSRRD